MPDLVEPIGCDKRFEFYSKKNGKPLKILGRRMSFGIENSFRGIDILFSQFWRLEAEDQGDHMAVLW